MTVAVLALVALAWAYTYAGYPLILAWTARRRPPRAFAPPAEWPTVTIVVPAYNAAATLGDTLRDAVALDYPADRRRIVVLSDASTDDTDRVARAFAPLGVRLLRLPERVGKTAAETAVGYLIESEIVVTMDAGTRVSRDALQALVAPLADPSVGVVSGRDVSVPPRARAASPASGEGAYVAYEMWLRDLETRVYGIVGASGCWFAMRAHLYRRPLPPALSRDFAAALIARAAGFCAVSAPAAQCHVARAGSRGTEYRRKVRTMARGLATLWHERALLDPTRYGVFAWMLWSHKVCRWLLPWTVPLACIVIAWRTPVALPVAGLAILAACAIAGRRGRALIVYIVLGTVAALHAWGRALRGTALQVWEPTQRGA